MTIRNQYLFTQAYLDQVMADPSHDEAAATLGQALADWAPFRDDASLSTLIDSWVGPVLDILGFHHQGVEGQPGLERLYTDFTAQELLGLCLTVPPGAEIDSTIKGAHYAFQIIAALRDQGRTWGVLTDGSHWRLVRADVLRPYESYLEVALGPMMRTRPTAETLRVFHAFLRRDAFLPDDEGKTGLDEHLARSEEAAKAIQTHLKDKMESVLGALCRGFVMADGRQSYTDEQRAEIFDNATYLLYRILFILYAEARGLLPVGNPAYDEIGMRRLVGQAVRCHREGVPDPASTTLWDGLRRLSKAIYESDEARGVPAYNGGLFSDEDADDFSKGYLRDCFISDPHLARALFDLTRMRNTNTLDGHKAIDYRDLSVRALGGLYEGMLEYKLFLAHEKMYGIPDRKGGYQYKPATQVERPKRTYREIDAGDVYFAHSPTERKATGSYYTPEYIVGYIVKQTVERGLRERREPLEARLARWLGEVASALDDAERTRLQKAVDRELLHFVEREVLTFRVCDPAMGSGHFLVNAAHTIANFIVETLNLAPWENAELDGDPTIWLRRLVESCIFGVDLNPLAVELAKLSLWLHTVAEAKPLNFLDHHLKVGNSLIGAWARDLVSLPTAKPKVKQGRAEVDVRQIGLFEQLLADELPTMLGKVLDITKQPSDELEDIRVKEAADQTVDNLQAPFKAVADLWVSTCFGNEVTEGEYQEALRHTSEPRQVLPLPGIGRAQTIGREKRFFHWELEFPEVFYEKSARRDNPGFEAVVGNPPFGADFTADDKRFLDERFTRVKSYTKNSAMYFTELSADLAAEDGRVGLLSPKSICYSEGWYPCTSLIADGLDQIVDITKAFPGVLLEQVFFIVHEAIQPRYYRAGQMYGPGNPALYPVPKRFFEDTRTLVVGSSAAQFRIYEKCMAASQLMSSISRTQRGLNWQQRANLPGSNVEIYRGDRLGRYFLKEARDYVLLNGFEAEASYLLQPKIMSQTAPAHVLSPTPHLYLQCVLDKRGVLTFDTVENTFVSHPNYDSAFVLSWFNSRLFAWILYRFVYCQAVRSIRFDDPYVGKMPVRSIAFGTPAAVRDRLLEKGKALVESRGVRKGRQVTYAEFLRSELGHFLTTQLEEQPEQSDVIHDLLAYLGEQMMEMNKEKQAQGKGFLDWLGGYTGWSIEDWRLKTRVKAYWQHGWDEVRRALTQNRKVIEKASGRDVERGGALETIQSKFDESVTQLKPLLDRIASTDRLIDLILYRIYGFTEEEVAIVEELI